jgi:two-component system cell cycle response regulator PopA
MVVRWQIPERHESAGIAKGARSGAVVEISSLDARVLIVARDDALAGPLSQGLDRLGWRTVTARGPYAAVTALNDLPIEAAVVDVAGHGSELFDFGARLKDAAGPRRLPVIAVGTPVVGTLSEAAYDLALAPPLHPAQIALRLEQLVRTAVAEEEFALRRQTFAERGAGLEPPTEPNRPIRVLAVGGPAPQFLALSNALDRQGAEVIAAFTPYTAFDFLHEKPFDAVLLWGGEDADEAVSIAAGMRRNTRLFHIPALLYLQSPRDISYSELFHRGVSDVAAPDASEGDTASRVIELARGYRRQSAVRTALEKVRGSGLMDAATGLFTRDLFAGHLGRLADGARRRNRPLSLCMLKVAEKPELVRARGGGHLDRAMPQIGSMIARLVRAEDTAARLAPEVFALAFPATRAPAARAVGERISAVIGCTAFDGGRGAAPFVVEFDVGAAEVHPGESAAAALERAAGALIGERAAG